MQPLLGSGFSELLDCTSAEVKPSGEFIGWFRFRSPPDHAPEDLELGYRRRRSAGKGYATEASRALIDKGFSRARRRFLHRDWPTYVEGDQHGEVEYALTREEWRARAWRTL